jgi:hypothetical protein
LNPRPLVLLTGQSSTNAVAASEVSSKSIKSNDNVLLCSECISTADCCPVVFVVSDESVTIIWVTMISQEIT